MSQAIAIDLSKDDYAWGDVVEPGKLKKAVKAVTQPIKTFFSWMLRGARRVVKAICTSRIAVSLVDIAVSISTAVVAWKTAAFLVGSMTGATQIVFAVLIFFTAWSFLCHMFILIWRYLATS